MLTETEKQDLAETLWTREAPLNQSMLVDKILEETDSDHDFPEYDDIENLYPDPSDWLIQEKIGWIHEHTDLDTSELIHDENPDAVVDAIRDHLEPQEILEWWAISEWFASKLRDKGECILDNDYGIWWGRTCSGQSVVLDAVIQDIAKATLS